MSLFSKCCNRCICWVPNESWHTETLVNAAINAILMWQYWAHTHTHSLSMERNELEKESNSLKKVNYTIKEWDEYGTCVSVSVCMREFRKLRQRAISVATTNEMQSPIQCWMLMFYLFAIMVQLIIRLDDFAVKQTFLNRVLCCYSRHKKWLLVLPSSCTAF